MTITLMWWAALIGLALAIALILLKLNPTYSLLLGTIVGCLIGGAGFSGTIDIVVSGGQSVMGTIIRVLAAGVLAGVMMESGAADQIARAIVTKLGERLAIFSLALATMIICAVGVFIPVAVLIVAPIALEVGNRMGISKLALLIALSGGGKAGNIISPNPNTIAAASGFSSQSELIQPSQVMVASFIPALCGLLMAVLLASLMKNRGRLVAVTDIDEKSNTTESSDKKLPSLATSFVAPVVAVVLLLINPLGSMLHIELLTQFQVDAMYILPFAAIVGLLAMGQIRHVLEYSKAGLNRMVDVVLILIGAGAVGSLITHSDLPQQIVNLINSMGVPGTLLAPISGILMAAATASTSTGVILGSQAFGSSILSFGVSRLAAAVTMQAGATVIDALPQGNYFHVTGNAMHMDLKERLSVVPYEALVGLTMTIVATLMYIIL
ncbi:GntP family permease [Alloscardovia criceti]|uniref:GntP family permease n=1 Tax=Alloscardovia criceti TaxID=356828 RepID=UPI0003A0BD54|nr:SLC13 family permease [Alloscardovia criceti]